MNPPTDSAAALLRRGPFARYMAGEAISMLGTWMQQMAQGWVMAGLTTSAFTLGLVNFASGMPMLALTMFGGTVADRHDKRIILTLVMLVQAALAVAVGALVASNRIEVWHILVAGVCLGVSTAFEVPAAAALVPELVAKDQVSRAIAIDRSIFHATRLVGPALGGWLIGALGTAAAFYANAVSFSALIIALLSIRPRERGTPEEEAARQTGMAEGLRHVRSDRPTLTMIVLMTLSTIFVAPFFMVLMPLYSRHVLNVGPSQHGLLMGASGVGAMIGSMRLLGIAQHHRCAYLRGGALVLALAMSTLAAARGLGLALPAMVALTIGTSTIWGLANTIVQERAPDAIRGRVSAISGLSFFGVLPFAGLLTAKLADLAGMRTAMLTGGICFGIGAAVLLFPKHHIEPAEKAGEH